MSSLNLHVPTVFHFLICWYLYSDEILFSRPAPGMPFSSEGRAALWLRLGRACGAAAARHLRLAGGSRAGGIPPFSSHWILWVCFIKLGYVEKLTSATYPHSLFFFRKSTLMEVQTFSRKIYQLFLTYPSNLSLPLTPAPTPYTYINACMQT